MLSFNLIGIWCGYFLKSQFDYPQDVLLIITILFLVVFVLLIKQKYLLLRSVIVILLLSIMLLLPFTFSTSLLISLVNQTDKKLDICYLDPSIMYFRHKKIEPNSKIKLKLARGDDTEELCSRTFIIIATDNSGEIIYQKVITNITQDKILLIKD